MTKWEYLRETVTLYAPYKHTPALNDLNRLGAEGWELIMAERLADAQSMELACLFKRPCGELLDKAL